MICLSEKKVKQKLCLLVKQNVSAPLPRIISLLLTIIASLRSLSGSHVTVSDVGCGETFLLSLLSAVRCLRSFLHLQPVSNHTTTSQKDKDLSFDSAQHSTFLNSQFLVDLPRSFGSLSSCRIQFWFSRGLYSYRNSHIFLLPCKIDGGYCDCELVSSCCIKVFPNMIPPPLCFTVGMRFLLLGCCLRQYLLHTFSNWFLWTLFIYD